MSPSGSAIRENFNSWSHLSNCILLLSILSAVKDCLRACFLKDIHRSCLERQKIMASEMRIHALGAWDVTWVSLIFTLPPPAGRRPSFPTASCLVAGLAWVSAVAILLSPRASAKAMASLSGGGTKISGPTGMFSGPETNGPRILISLKAQHSRVALQSLPPNLASFQLSS